MRRQIPKRRWEGKGEECRKGLEPKATWNKDALCLFSETWLSLLVRCGWEREEETKEMKRLRNTSFLNCGC